MSDGKAGSGVTTEDNPACGLSGPQRRETKYEYEYIQSSAAAPQLGDCV